MYIPLNVKTNYYLLSSLNAIDSLITKAITFNINSIAITDSSMYSVMDFYKICLKNNIKPIIGQEIVVDNNAILLYAMTYQGYQNLTRLVYLKQDSNITIDVLKQYSDNLLCIVPFNSLLMYDTLKGIYKHIYLGYSNTFERNELSSSEEKKVLINEVLYLNKKDSNYLKYLYLIRDGKKISDLDDYKLNDNSYLLDNDEVKSLCDDDNLRWMKEISDLCNITFESNPNLLPKYSVDSTLDSKVYLNSLCKVGLAKRLNNQISNEYVHRLKYELSVIDKMGFNNYFLVVYDFVKYAKKNNILVGPGRGSAAGSLVSYCLGITDVDPLKYNLLFERFLNPERVTMPDIDIDFESLRRGEVVNYVIQKYGAKHVAPIIAFVTLSGKQALRDVARIFDYTSTKIDTISKMIDVRYSLKENLNNPRINGILNTDIDLINIYKIASFIEGAKRQASIHAAGIVISELELDSYIPLQKYDNYYITGYSMEHLEELGLLKIDFLGIKNLTLIEGVLKNINDHEAKPLLFKDIPLDDKKTLELFSKAMTEGVFQFESEGMKNFLRKLKPTTFEEIVAANALFRPGPMDNIDSYIKRKEGKEKIDYLHKDLYDILKPTYGIIVYQEQIMQIANVMAGYSLGEADILRRAMSKKKKEVLVLEEDKFIKRSIAKGYNYDTAVKVYQLILKFANYGFNRAHAVAYALVGYKMAYLKVHYAKYFMSNLLTNVIGNNTKTKEYINECRMLGINILKPDINRSGYSYTIEKDGIRFSLAAISGVGGITCKEIIKEREKGLFKDFFDFVGRTYGKAITTKTIELLIDADCLSSFNYNHQTLIYNIDNAITYAELVSNVDPSLIEKPIIGITLEMKDEELTKREFMAFGFYLTNHPVAQYKAEDNSIINVSQISNHFDKIIDVIIYVDKIKIIKTKNNEDMAFITGSDESGSIDLVMFPSLYKDNQFLNNDMIIRAKARVEKRMSRYQLSVLKVEILRDL